MLNINPVMTALAVATYSVSSFGHTQIVSNDAKNQNNYVYSLDFSSNNNIAEVYVSVSNQEGPLAMSNKIRFDTLVGDGLKLKFINPFTLTFNQKDDCYIANFEDIGYYGYGESLKELEEDFVEQMLVDWQMYVICSEEELSLDALELRYKLKKLLMEV